jgi:hypothetical protein
MGEEKALNVGPSGIEMAYEQFGDPGRRQCCCCTAAARK